MEQAPDVCTVCGKELGYIPPCRKKEGYGKYCSRACMGVAKRLPDSVRNAQEISCSRCGQTRPVSEFYKHLKTARGYQSMCKDCTRTYRQENDKPAEAAAIRKWRLARYGITPEQYDKLYTLQRGLCAICGKSGLPWEPRRPISERKLTLVVDHCHTAGTVRGLLCWNCNCGIGQLQDSIPTLLAAVRYIQRFQVPAEDGPVIPGDVSP